MLISEYNGLWLSELSVSYKFFLCLCSIMDHEFRHNIRDL